MSFRVWYRNKVVSLCRSYPGAVAGVHPVFMPCEDLVWNSRGLCLLNGKQRRLSVLRRWWEKSACSPQIRVACLHVDAGPADVSLITSQTKFFFSGRFRFPRQTLACACYFLTRGARSRACVSAPLSRLFRTGVGQDRSPHRRAEV